MKRVVLGALAVAATVSLLGGCGGSDKTGEAPLNDDQVQLIANTLYRNHAAGGITFSLATVGDTGSGTVTIQGDVDFTNLVGRAMVNGGAGPNPVTEVYWGGVTVLESRPSLWPYLADKGYENARYVARDGDTKARRLDVLLQTVMSMGMEQPENAVLVRQREGSAYLRDDELRGTKVQVLRFGDRLIMWIDPLTGDLLRFEGTNTERTFPIVIDVLSRGPRTVEGPAAIAVVPASALGEEYLQLTPKSP